MPSARKIHLYRFLERLIQFIFVIGTVGTAVIFSLEIINRNDLIVATGVLVFLLIVIIFIQRAIDNWLIMILASASSIKESAFESLYERSPVAYITINDSGVIKNANPSAVNLLKSHTDTIKGINFYQLINTEDSTDVEVLRSKVNAGLTINDDEVSISTTNGESIWVMLSVSSYKQEGESLVAMVDVTEQKTVDTAKSEFVALATHQLRTPIAAIRWNVELLERSLRETKTEAQGRYVEKIERNVIRMINLINDFLSVSKLEMGTYAADIATVNMSEFFDAILDEFSEKIKEKQLNVLRNDNPPQLVVQIDNRLIHIIISNLVSNAVKYLNPEGALTLTYQLIDKRLEIVIADNGIGVPQEEVEKLFTKFYRASNAQTHHTEGTGLGLYIVKQSVDQLRGSISVESDENKGAKFIVNIPVSVISTHEIG